jgi:hypothetical protein
MARMEGDSDSDGDSDGDNDSDCRAADYGIMGRRRRKRNKRWVERERLRKRTGRRVMQVIGCGRPRWDAARQSDGEG